MVVNFFLFLINLSVILGYNKFSFLTTSKIITIFFIAQLFFSYINYFTLIEYKPYTFEENYLLQGIYNNRNVTSALYLLQLPFVVYIALETKSVFIKIISFIISFAAAYMIFLLASRTAYVILTVLLLSILIILYSLTILIKKNFPIIKNTSTLMKITIFSSNGILTGMTGSLIIPGVFYFQSLDFNKEKLIQALGIHFSVLTLFLGLSKSYNNYYLTQDLLFASFISCIFAFFVTGFKNVPVIRS